MAVEINGTTGVSLIQDGAVTAADLSSTLDLSSKTLTLPAESSAMVLLDSGAPSATEYSLFDIDFTSYTNYSDYNSFKLVLNGWSQSSVTDSYIGFYQDGTFNTETQYWHSIIETNGGSVGANSNIANSAIRINWYAMSTSSTKSNALDVDIIQPTSSSTATRLMGTHTSVAANNNGQMSVIGGGFKRAESTTGIRLYPSGGTVAFHFGWKLYGVKG